MFFTVWYCFLAYVVAEDHFWFFFNNSMKRNISPLDPRVVLDHYISF